MGYHHYSICSFIIPPHLRTGKKICVIRHAPGKGSCYVVAVAGEEVYVLTVDKAGFDEDGGHSGVAQDAEGGMGFDAAVFVACVKGGRPERKNLFVRPQLSDGKKSRNGS